MNDHNGGHGEQGEVFLDQDDIIQEIAVDEEDLPDADDEIGSDADDEDADDSIHIFTGHTDEVYTVACSPSDASLVATGGGDDKGFCWKIGRADWNLELQGHKDSVSALAFSADGQLLACGSFDGLVQVWDMSSSSLKCVLEGPGMGIEWVRWHPKGHLVLGGSEDSTVWMWNADKNAYLNSFSGHGGSVTCGDFTPDGKTICTGSDDASLRIWNPKTGENIHVVKGHPYHTAGLTCLAITPDSTLAITGSQDGSVHIVNITTGKAISSLIAHSDSVECIGLSSRFMGGVTCLLWLGKSQFIATGCVDGKIRLWDSLSGNCRKTFHGHTDVIQSLAISADEEHLVSCSLDGTARVFDISEFR
ncbi:hypothetical protein Taro_027828 [Colocasia esculenta]|uniref:Angio-associated migratory cell protein n=1 Tax=Colocasia esculenta TaxID=4460 RepID=A0A843VJ79_COLES|nr:hypothetical protein [Colocasia esculenta]